jgi:hypothetical protein
VSASALKNIKVSKLRTAVLSIEHISRVLVKWDLAPTAQDLSNLTFVVDRGESPSALVPISHAIPATALREFVDYTAKLKNVEKVYYYRVRAVETIADVPTQTFLSETLPLEGRPDLVALYIVEEHLFAHRYVYGSPALIFKHMMEGTACKDCFDPVLKRVTKSNCTTCYGTGFLGGYYPFMESWMDFNPDPKQVQIAEWGARQPSQTDIQFTNYPLLAVGDLIVELKQNRYWKVANVRNTEKNRTTILQVCRLDEVNRSDIEYKIEVPDEARLRLLKELEDREAVPEF